MRAMPVKCLCACAHTQKNKRVSMCACKHANKHFNLARTRISHRLRRRHHRNTHAFGSIKKRLHARTVLLQTLHTHENARGCGCTRNSSAQSCSHAQANMHKHAMHASMYCSRQGAHVNTNKHFTCTARHTKECMHASLAAIGIMPSAQRMRAQIP